MMTNRYAAAQYTEISLDDMEKFLKRAFMPLRPTRSERRGEYAFDLRLSRYVGIRVWTSVKLRSGMGAEMGKDLIKVHLVSLVDDGGLQGRDETLKLKRTQGWKTTLQDKIETLMERYEEREDFWDNWAKSRSRGANPNPEREIQEIERQLAEDEDGEGSDGRPVPQRHPSVPPPRQPSMRPQVPVRPPEPVHVEAPDETQSGFKGKTLYGEVTPKQINYIRVLLRGVDHSKWQSLGLAKITGIDHIPRNDQLGGMTKQQASNVIDTLLKAGHGRRYASEMSDYLQELGCDFSARL